MYVVYCAGKFRDKNSWLIEQNIRRAEEVAYELWQAGFAVVCPQANTRFFDKCCDDEVFLHGLLAIMRRCDAVVVVPGWEKSEGTKIEIAEMEKLGKPVLYWANLLLTGRRLLESGEMEPIRDAVANRIYLAIEASERNAIFGKEEKDACNEMSSDTNTTVTNTKWPNWNIADPQVESHGLMVLKKKQTKAASRAEERRVEGMKEARKKMLRNGRKSE